MTLKSLTEPIYNRYGYLLNNEFGKREKVCGIRYSRQAVLFRLWDFIEKSNQQIRQA